VDQYLAALSRARTDPWKGECHVLSDTQDAYGHELLDHLAGRTAYEIMERDDGFVSVGPGPRLYFSMYEDWQPSEKEAMRFVRGRVLDIGCGAGRHALYLQSQAHDVLAIDISPGAIEVCLMRGVRAAMNLSVTGLSRRLGEFDTILMLGANFGLCATPARARWLLRRFHRATAPGGRLLAASIDPHQTDAPEHLVYHRNNVARGRLPGQLRLRVRYRKYATPWHGLLLVSPEEMATILDGTGWRISRLLEDGGAPYVAIVEKDKGP
jgi:SAM-dependent methyltransferase